MGDSQQSAAVDTSAGFAGSLSPSEPLSGTIRHYPSRWPFSGNSGFSDFFLLLRIFLEPLSNILTSLTDKGRLLIDSLIQWFRIHIFERYGHQAPSRHKWRVNSKELKTNRFLGQGFSGIIYETTWLGRENLGLLARKDFPVVNGDVFENEAARLVGLGDHPNIVKSLCWTIDRRSCSLVMEYVRYDLYSVVQKRKGEQRMGAASADTFPPITSVKAITSPFDLLTSIKLILQIATGMMHLHDRGIAHGDLKPNNILVSSETSPMLVKVADFGLNETKRRSTTLVSHRARCLQIVKWKAPELFEDHLGSLSVDSDNLWTGSLIESDIGKMANASNSGVSGNARMRRADVYSFALTCSYILGVQTWDPNLSWIELQKDILCGLRPQLPSGCPRSLASLISSCWADDPILRPTFMSICRELQVIISEQNSEGFFTTISDDSSVESLPGVVRKKPTGSEDKQRVEEFLTQIPSDSNVDSLPSVVPKKPREDKWSSHGNREDPGSIWGSSRSWGSSHNDEDKGSFDDDEDEGDLEALYKFLEIGSPAGLGLQASDWEARKSPRSDSNAGSLPFWLVSPARPIERELKAHGVVKPVSSAGHENSPYQRPWPTPTGAKVSVVEKVEESLTPISGDGSVESLPGAVRKKPRWSTWSKGEILGSGTFGTVYEGVGSNGMFFAVRELSFSDQGRTGKHAISQLEQEIALLSEIQHPNIVQYLGTEKNDEKLYIFQELVSKGSLVTLYEKYEFFYGQVRAYTKQILSGLKYLHDRKIIHRGIKCANIMVDASGVVKLADFGLAKQVDKLGIRKSFLSSADWSAPEVVNSRRSYNLKADIWSLGCTVLEMAIGKPPFGDLETHTVLWKIGHGEGPPIPDDLEEDLKNFIANCLVVNVETRPTCDLLLTHPFITSAPMIGPVKLVATSELPSIAEGKVYPRVKRYSSNQEHGCGSQF